jgi:hypothetical protein
VPGVVLRKELTNPVQLLLVDHFIEVAANYFLLVFCR